MTSLDIDTARLRLRPLTADDLDNLHRLWTDPFVRKYIWDDEVISRERTASIIEKSTAMFETERVGLWGMYPRDRDTLIGFCGFWVFPNSSELQLFYGISPNQWGEGLATEAARAMITHGFQHCGFDRIIASADTPNTASHRVMEKAGMTFEKRAETAGHETVFYAISRDDYVHA
jgi:ribosomal-protein-alanine N-acetyltransferase